jgi:hypothetical protein
MMQLWPNRYKVINRGKTEVGIQAILWFNLLFQLDLKNKGKDFFDSHKLVVNCPEVLKNETR